MTVNKTFEQSVTDTRALIAAGTIHPAALIDLARNRIMRLQEWNHPAEWMQRALDVLAEAKAATAAFNAAR